MHLLLLLLPRGCCQLKVPLTVTLAQCLHLEQTVASLLQVLPSSAPSTTRSTDQAELTWEWWVPRSEGETRHCWAGSCPAGHALRQDCELAEASPLLGALCVHGAGGSSRQMQSTSQLEQGWLTLCSSLP